MKWLQSGLASPNRTTGDDGQVMEWHIRFPIYYGKLVAEPEMEPSVEKPKNHELSNDGEISNAQQMPQQNARQRWRNILQASPILTTAVIFFLMPLDIWLPTLLRYICHDSATVPEPKSHLIITVLLSLSTYLLFTVTSCIAFYRHDISSTEPVTGLFSLFSHPLFATQLIGKTTRFRWPIIMWSAGVAGWANALFLRKTIDAFNSGAFSASASGDQDASSRRTREILFFTARLVAKAAPTLFVAVEYFDPSSSSLLYYLQPINVAKVFQLYLSLYLLQNLCVVIAQSIIASIIPRAICGPLYIIVDREDWALDMRIGSRLDPGPIEVKEGRKAEDVRVVQLSVIISALFSLGCFAWMGWQCVMSLWGLVFG